MSTKKLEALAQLRLWDAKERETALTVEENEVRRGVVDEFKKWGKDGGNLLEAKVKRVVAKRKGQKH